jgi:hypothetical protein
MTVHWYWLTFTLPVFAVALWLLVRVARGLLRATRASVVAAAPMREVITLPIGEPGDYALYVEGRRFSRDFGGLDYAMRDRNNSVIPLGNALMRTEVSSFDRVRLEVRTFHLAGAGTVTLHVTGIHAQSDPENRIVVARPVMGTVVLYVLALVVLGALTVASFGGSLAIAILAHRQGSP